MYQKQIFKIDAFFWGEDLLWVVSLQKKLLDFIDMYTNDWNYIERSYRFLTIFLIEQQSYYSKWDFSF